MCNRIQYIYSYTFQSFIQGLEYRYSNIDIPKYRNCFQWFFEYPNIEIQAKPISVLYRNNRNSSKANFGYSEIGNALSNTCLVQYTILYTLNEYALQLTGHSVLRIDFTIICHWLFSRLFPHRLDTLQSMRYTGGKHSHLHIIAKSIRNALCAVSCNAYSYSV